MRPGETVLQLDAQNHLWIVVSAATADGRIALVNLTTHGKRRFCGADCLVLSAAEHPWIQHDSCVYFRGAELMPEDPFERARERGTLTQHQPVSAELLQKVQSALLASRITPENVKTAIRNT